MLTLANTTKEIITMDSESIQMFSVFFFTLSQQNFHMHKFPLANCVAMYEAQQSLSNSLRNLHGEIMQNSY